MGKYYEDFSPGEEFRTQSRTIGEYDVLAFAGLSGDNNPLHTDAEFSRGTIYGERIAHGLLGMSIASGLISRTGLFEGTALAFLGVEDWTFLAPIKFGDTVYVEFTVSDKRETKDGDRGILIRQVRLKNQHDEVVQRGVMPLMIKKGNS